MFGFLSRFRKSDNKSSMESVDLAGIANLIKSGKVNNVITMAGAGISTAAGIPDFRSDVGLYKKLTEEYNMENPMDVFTLSCFKENPKPFYEVAKKLYKPDAKPTLTHYFIRLLHEKGLLLRHYTQNVDNLERISGLPDEKLIEAHGSFQSGHCITCSRRHSFEYIKDAVINQNMPICQKENCGGVVKPDVVLFGEGLPPRFMSSIADDFNHCDLLIVMGTSLAVQPFCSLIHRVHSNVPRLYLNREYHATHGSGLMDFLMKFYVAKFKSNSFHFDDPDNSTDVFHACNTDDGVSELCREIGWEQDLLRIRDENNKSL